MAKQDKDKKKKRKLKEKAKNKKQQFDNPFLGKPVQDDRLPDFEISGNFTSKGYNVKDVKFDLTEGIGDNVNIAYGKGSRRVNMTRSTLEKSRATLIGMAPQERFFWQDKIVNGQRVLDPDTNKYVQVQVRQRVQGFNYANPDYTNAIANEKALQEAKRFYGVGSVGVDKRTQFENNKKKVQAILDARVAVASLPEHLKTDKIISSIKNKPYEQTEQEKINQANTNARLKQASRNKVKNALANIGRDPTVGYANEIQSKLGRAPISVVVTRRRRGRWSTSLSADPKKVIEDYHSKTALINWAKEVDPEHAQIDPERKVSVVDTSTPRRVTHTWCHNNRCRITGYSTVYDKTYKDVLATSRPEGEKMDLLYGKIMKQSKSKKKKYSTYYETNPELEDYNYYGITDDEFDQMDEYKTALVTNIRNTRDAESALGNKIIGNFRIDATSTLDDNAPKQKYLQYQKTGQDDFITPTVNKLQSQITPQSTSTEQQNLQNAIAFVEGKSKDFVVNGGIVASRDNFGRIKITNQLEYSKYIKNTPSEYLRQPDQLDTTVIPELEEENKETTEKYNEMEKEYYRKQRAKAQFGTIRPKGRMGKSRGGRRRRR